VLPQEGFQKCEEDHPEFIVGGSLMGIVTDWNDAEISCLGEAIDREAAENSYEDVRFIGCDRGNVSGTYCMLI